MHAFTQPPALAARSTRVARRLPSPSRRRAAPAPQSPRSAPRASSEESPRPAPRASSEEARRAETPSEPRRDAHAPRSYTREYSVDGDESYPLGAKGFGRAETNQGVRSTWGGDDANTERRFSFVDPPYEQTVVTAASTHTRHPHVLSVKLPRPVADHIKFQPRTAPPLSGAVAELRDLDVNESTDFEPTGAVVTAVNPGPPGLAHGLIQPGDVLAVMVDEWKQPTDFFVRAAPFSAIERAVFERSDKPVTLRFERYVKNESDSIDTREFIGSHVGDRTSVHHSRFT